MYIGNREFKTGAGPYVMGILNVTPDSFSDGGSNMELDKALFHVEEMIQDGADVIDIGGESTRPGHTKISDEEEIERVVPVIEAVKKNFDTCISLDTYKPGVAKAGILAGAELINDIWGLKYDSHMAQLIAKYDVACCLMHNRSNHNYSNLLDEVVEDLNGSLEIARQAGVDMKKVMIDPGIGFGKNLEQNLVVMNNLERLTKWKLPVLLGTSRKSMIGNTLNLPVDEREEATIATSVMGLMKGCDFFRVHNVKGNYRALKMTKAIMDSGC